ncbi:ATP-binding protein [Methylophaga sp.]|jgi:two-component system sensor histidine kinase FlrB|uniref:sensor histidine kinase n=1 Tax=Methylophaga sp. TaxID=2024840 RepID=UPI0013FF4D37|nr:ATP-binding protein [Methylophaga sp.]MTI63767.1 PAS domain-containing protein [Methylophaga sp.]
MNLKLSTSSTDTVRPPVGRASALKQAEQFWQPASASWQRETSADKQQADRLANRHSRLLEVLPAGVVVIDGEGIVQEANAAAIDLLGEPLSGERWIHIIDRAFSPQPGDGHDVSLRDGRLVHISTSPMGTEPGQIILLQDVTDTRALQNKVSHLQRLSTMGEVAARLAHQIRTPLSSALLYLAPLLKEDSEPAVRQRFAGRLKHSLTHMEQLVRDMLAFSRGSMASTSPVAITELLDEVLQQFQSQPQSEQFQISIHNNVNDGHVYGSQAALASAINNLLNNARQACGDEGNIRIFAEFVEDNDQAWIDLSVEDNGPGISEADRDKILTPFYTTRANGTGLGLAVVQSIAKAHKGELWVESDEGEGSTFGLRLPVYQSQVQADATAAVQQESVS